MKAENTLTANCRFTFFSPAVVPFDASGVKFKETAQKPKYT